MKPMRTDTLAMEADLPRRGRETAAEAAEDLAALYDAHAGALYRYALTLLSSTVEAEDVVQEVFLGLMRRRGRGRIEHLREYLLRATRNQAFSLLRKRKVREAGETWIEIAAEVGDPNLTADISTAISRLPVEQREVIELRLGEGLGFRELAEVLGIPQNTAASRHRLAISKLRAMLAGEEDE
jgi:RNA polymerase sigma-70 factor (ECF subfamily)